MRWLLPLLAASLVLLGLSLSSAGARRGGGEVSSAVAASAAISASGPARTTSAASRALRVGCEQPGTLRLRRFEDRSARLECAGRVLVRVSVPG